MDWCSIFSTQEAGLEELKQHSWPNGFKCPCLGHEQAHILTRYCIHQFTQYRHHASVTGGTVFEHTKLPLPKWFVAIYLISLDKGGISDMRLMQMVGISWVSAQQMLRKLRPTMGDRDYPYRLSASVEVDDAFIDGKRCGKLRKALASADAVGKVKRRLGSVEGRGNGAGFLAVEVVKRVDPLKMFKCSRIVFSHSLWFAATPLLL